LEEILDWRLVSGKAPRLTPSP